ncbi:MAG: hypothetical protein AAGI46_16400 [Planctomycetota bacterium]
MSRYSLLLLGVVVLLAAGCSTRPAWQDDPKAATIAYWHEQPASVAVVADDYDTLWSAADNARRRFGFTVDFSDHRGGLLRTQPRTGGQWFEVWRDEQRTLPDVAEASLSTVRRSVQFDFVRDGSASRVEPRVVVEKLAVRGDTFRRAEDDPAKPRFGWHAAGRDTALEATLANRIAKRTGGTIVRADSAVVDSLRR